MKKKGTVGKLIKRFSCELAATSQRLDHTENTVMNLKEEMNGNIFLWNKQMVDILKKKLMFEILETVKRLTETNMAAGNLKDPNGNTRIIII